jgi:radical SAM-linked protein
MARGDRKLGDVILEAWKAGARFDGWDERFNLDLWTEAAEAAGVDLSVYTGPISSDEPLPWSAVSVGVDIDFLRREREAAFEGRTTPDCRTGECGNCGACGDGVTMRFCKPEDLSTPSDKNAGSAGKSPRTPENAPDTAYGRRKQPSQEKPAGFRYRFFYEKREPVRFLGHLDMVEVFHRAMTAAAIPLAFSQGFNPHPRVSFGPPLPFGATGLNEAFDIETKTRLEGNPLDINKWLPDGLRITSHGPIDAKASLNSAVAASLYRIFPPKGFSIGQMEEMIESVSNMKEITVTREKNGRQITKDIRPAIIKTSVCNDDGNPCWEAVLSLSPGKSCKPSEFVSALCPGEDFSGFTICRVEYVMF